MTTETPATELRFERQTCSRCGGSGQHSFCQGYGSKCFKCHGKGEVLTKRGAAASAYMNSLTSCRADEIKVGDRFRDSLVTAGGQVARVVWTVEEVRPTRCVGSSLKDGVMTPYDEAAVEVVGKWKSQECHFTYFAKSTINRIWKNEEERLELLKQAIAYQDTLTKNGSPRKR